MPPVPPTVTVMAVQLGASSEPSASRPAPRMDKASWTLASRAHIFLGRLEAQMRVDSQTPSAIPQGHVSTRLGTRRG